MAEIILTFENDGKTVHKETKGFIGPDCVKKTKFVEEALGMVGSRRFKTEYHESGEHENERDKTKN